MSQQTDAAARASLHRRATAAKLAEPQRKAAKLAQALRASAKKQ